MEDVMASEVLTIHEQGFPCAVCGEMDNGAYGEEDDDGWPTRVGARVCGNCERRFPDSLLFASSATSGHFVLRLRTGEVCEFQTAEVFGEFVTLSAIPGTPIISEHFSSSADQLDVRLADVVWCTVLRQDALVTDR
jgi:hypothetical protein